MDQSVILRAWWRGKAIALESEKTIKSGCDIFCNSEIETMNTKLVESLIQTILALSPEERVLLESKLFWHTSDTPSYEIMHFAQNGETFDFFEDEPDLYTLEE